MKFDIGRTRWLVEDGNSASLVQGMSREDLHRLAQRTCDLSTLHPRVIDEMRLQRVGPWQHEDGK